MYLPFVFFIFVLTQLSWPLVTGLKLGSTSSIRRRKSVANPQLTSRHTSKLHSTSPTSDKISTTIVFEPNFATSLLVAVSIAIAFFFFGQNVKLDAKSDINAIAEKLAVRIESKLVELKMESNEKFAELKMESNEKFAELKMESNEKFVELKMESNEKFAEQAKSLDELKDLKTGAGVLVAIGTFVGFVPTVQYLSGLNPRFGPNATSTISKGDSAEKE